MGTKTSVPRAKKNPPHVSLGALRAAAGLTIEGLLAKLKQDFPEMRTNKGTISAIELGIRGASPQMLSALCRVYGLPDGSITTDYVPRNRKEAAA